MRTYEIGMTDGSKLECQASDYTVNGSGESARYRFYVLRAVTEETVFKKWWRKEIKKNVRWELDYDVMNIPMVGVKYLRDLGKVKK